MWQMTKSQRRRQSLNASRRYRSLGQRRKTARSLKRYLASPEGKRQRSKTASKNWRNPKFRAAVQKGVKKYWSSAESRQKASERSIKAFQSRAAKKRLSDAQLKAWNRSGERKRRQRLMQIARRRNQGRAQLQFEAAGWKVLSKGWPDFVIFKGKRVRFIEVKSGFDRLRSHQVQMHDTFRRVGLTVEVIHL